jgi:hypothetical protein
VLEDAGIFRSGSGPFCFGEGISALAIREDAGTTRTGPQDHKDEVARGVMRLAEVQSSRNADESQPVQGALRRLAHGWLRTETS